MATFDELLQQFKQKKLDGAIPMERPADDLGVLPALQEPAYQQTSEDIAAQKSNEQMLGLPSIEIPYRPEGNIAGINLPQAAPAMAAAEPTQEAAPELDVVKAMRNIGSRATQQNTLPPTASAAPVAPAVSNDMQEYKDAQALAEKRRMIAGMLKAGSEIGEGIGGLGAGARLNMPESKGLKYLEESANTPITDLAAKRKAEKEGLDLMDDRKKNDPNSEVSKLYRDVTKKLGLEVGANATAADLEKSQPVIGNIILKMRQEEEMKLRRDELSANRADREASKLLTKQELDSSRWGKEATSQPAYKRFQENQEAYNFADKLFNGEIDPNGVDDGALILQAVKLAQADSSVVRDSDQKLFNSVGGLEQASKEFLQKIKEGTRLTPETRRAYIEMMRTAKDNLAKAAKEQTSHIYSKFKKSGIPEDYIPGTLRELNKIGESANSKMAAGEPSGAIVITPQGKEIKMPSLAAAQAFKKEHPEIKIKGE